MEELKNKHLIEVLTVNEAAAIWGVSEGAIRYHIRSGTLRNDLDFRKAGRITLITREAMTRIFGAEKVE